MVSREFLYMVPSVPIVQFIFAVSDIGRLFISTSKHTIILLVALLCLFNDVLHDPLPLGMLISMLIFIYRVMATAQDSIRLTSLDGLTEKMSFHLRLSYQL